MNYQFKVNNLCIYLCYYGRFNLGSIFELKLNHYNIFKYQCLFLPLLGKIWKVNYKPSFV